MKYPGKIANIEGIVFLLYPKKGIENRPFVGTMMTAR
jgi:hypothetical protein